MNASELRIGNWINYPRYWGDRPIRVTGISVVDRRDDHTGIYEEFLYLLGNDFLTDENFDSFVEYKQGVISPEEANPIPLTEEWLLKFGFGKENGYPYKFPNGVLKIRNGVYFFKHNDIEIDLHFVHQLQNLYFALTGKEL